MQRVVNVQLGVDLTVCPGCERKQFKFQDWVNDSIRHELSVRLLDELRPARRSLTIQLFDPKAATYV